MKRSWRLLLAITAFTLACAAQAAPPRPFEDTSYGAILAARTGRPFLLAFWSLDCPPCLAELATLGDLRREGPAFELILVSTDGLGAAAAIERTLGDSGLADVESWTFGTAAPERLRFAADRRWRGELPRSYWFNADHHRTAHTGRLERAQIEQWLRDWKRSAP